MNVINNEPLSLMNFVQNSSSLSSANHFFEIENSRFLEINLINGQVAWAKSGSMIAYYGQVRFESEFLENGLEKAIKRLFTGETNPLMKISGIGKVYLADQGKKIHVFRLENQSITVNGNDILAFDSNLEWDVKISSSFGSMLATGIFNIVLKGTGWLAITTHYDPISLVVNEFTPVYADPNATVAWSTSLKPKMIVDVTLKNMIRSNNEILKMEFSGKQGFVILQPFEEKMSRSFRDNHRGRKRS